MKSLCTICQEEFDSVGDMKKHVFLTHIKKDYICPVCKKAFGSFGVLKIHLMEHEQIVHTCHFCKKTFVLASDLQYHLRTNHAGEDHPDTCTVCTTGSEKSIDMELDVAVNSFENGHGSNSSVDSSGSKEKVATTTSFVCEDCKMVFMTSAEYVKHLLTHKKESYKFFCEQCNKGFVASSAFEKHMLTHEELNSYVCEQCNEIFKRYSKFEEHLLTHKEKKPHVCEICKVAFVLDSEFEKHMLIHGGGAPTLQCDSTDELRTQRTPLEVPEKEQKPYVCEACKIAFAQYGDFETHLLTHQDMKTYFCKVCKKMFTKAEEFEAHLLLHANKPSNRETSHANEFEKFLTTGKDVSYGCDSCEETFAQLLDLEKHKSRCGGVKEKKFRCSVCHEKFLSDGELRKHSLTHGKNKFNCSICKEEFPLKFLLNQHLHLHNNLEENLVCKICSKSFDNIVDLKEHMTISHLEKDAKRTKKLADINDTTKDDGVKYLSENSGQSAVTVKKVLILPGVRNEILSKKPRKFDCKVCETSFPRTSGLKSHLITHLGRKLYYECKNCAKIFLHKSSLEMHRHGRPGRVQHVCTICDIGFLRPNQFTKHLLTHMREVNHRCQICGKVFLQAAELGRHVDSHKCDVCGDVFQDPVDLKLHFLSHTEDRPFSCQVCSSDFVWNSCLDKNTGSKMDTAMVGSSLGETSSVENVSTFCENIDDAKKRARCYLCDICGARFTSSYSLTNHLFAHSGEKPYQCQSCKKCFVVRSKLKSHTCNC